ncbi:hypothetical protein ABW21_db0208555 [Orbilia brochopaga]|nr:hypothetical protein ABW21_db0208555 [Drechslerella brochopaga]
MAASETDPLLGGSRGSDRPPPYTFSPSTPPRWPRPRTPPAPRVSTPHRCDCEYTYTPTRRDAPSCNITPIVVAITIIVCWWITLPYLQYLGLGSGNDTHPALPSNTSCPKAPPLGLKFNDAPWPGATYAITERNTTNAITFYDRDSIILSPYRPGQATQRWTCRKFENWLGFTIQPGDTPVYLGFAPWPYPPFLRAVSTVHRFNEMFVVMKRPENGFDVYFRDGGSLRPLGKDGGGTLARVGETDSWWGFTKVN